MATPTHSVRYGEVHMAMLCHRKSFPGPEPSTKRFTDCLQATLSSPLRVAVATSASCSTSLASLSAAWRQNVVKSRIV